MKIHNQSKWFLPLTLFLIILMASVQFLFFPVSLCQSPPYRYSHLFLFYSLQTTYSQFKDNYDLIIFPT